MNPSLLRRYKNLNIDRIIGHSERFIPFQVPIRSISEYFRNIQNILDVAIGLVDETKNVDNVIRSGFVETLNVVIEVLLDLVSELDRVGIKDENTIDEIKRAFYYFMQYCYGSSRGTDFNESTYLIKLTQIDDFITQYLLLKSFQNPIDLLNNVTQVTSDANKKANELMDELSSSLDLTKANNTTIQSLITELSKKAAEKTNEQYAMVFGDEAKNHSSMDMGFKKASKVWKIWEYVYFRLGAAEWWFFIGLGLIFILIYILFSLLNGSIIKFSPESHTKFSSYDIYEMLSFIFIKLTILSIFVFLINLSFKQFRINKHLYTQNKHRQNILNSYKLLILTGTDANTQNAIALHVAKAIYEFGKSGYLNEKQADLGSPNIVEITKLIPQK